MVRKITDGKLELCSDQQPIEVGQLWEKVLKPVKKVSGKTIQESVFEVEEIVRVIDYSGGKVTCSTVHTNFIFNENIRYSENLFRKMFVKLNGEGNNK